jgi:uncharacterized damage-inducible protein DinB
MLGMPDIMKYQYELIRSVRQHLFDFMEEMPLEKLHETVSGFGIGKIIGAHIHVADSYRYWIGSFAFQQKPSEYADTPISVIENADVKKAREIFDSVDETVERFLERYQSCWLEEIENEVDLRDTPLRLTPLFLL